MKKQIIQQFILGILILAATTTSAHVIPVDEVSKNSIKIIENKGQWQSHILFRAQIPGGTLFITRNGFVYAMVEESKLHEMMHHQSEGTMKGHNYRVNFIGANSNTQVSKFQPSTEYYNFFIGNDPSKWASACKAYDKVVIHNLYNGIDLEIIALDSRIKTNFIVKPMADASQIQMQYEGLSSMQLEQGALNLQTTVASVKEMPPIAMQPALNNTKVEVAYAIHENIVSFNRGDYNPLFPLVIDPEIVFGTFSGSVADNFGFTATFDNSGNGYAGGTVYDVGFPVTMGAYQTTFLGGIGNDPPARDCGILKFSANGRNLLYCTYLGGSSNEQPHSIICAPNGELIIMGTTLSTNFPTTLNAYDRTQNGLYDIFVTRLSANGSAIVGSTFYGGTKNDGINGTASVGAYNQIAAPLKYNFGDQFRGEVNLDRFGNIVIVSSTQSNTADLFPIMNGFQNIFGGGTQDGCIARFNSNLSSLQFSSYLGGSGHDAVYGVSVDVFNNYVIAGGTNSSNITPTYSNFSYRGGIDAFVGRVSSGGNVLQRFLYVGTSNYDQAYFSQIDEDGKIYITGQTEGNNFPAIGNVFRVPGAKHFISIFNSNLDSMTISTTFGKTGSSKPSLAPSAFLVDICGRIYFSGWGGETNQMSQDDLGNTFNLPVTSDAFQKTTDGSDFYLSVFAPGMESLRYATYIGDLNNNDHVDGGTSRFDRNGIVYQSVCAGCGGSSGFPTTTGAWSTINKGLRPGSTAGGCNNALFKMDLNVSAFPPKMIDTLLTIIAGDSISYSAIIEDQDGDVIETNWQGNMLGAGPNSTTVNFIKQPGKNTLLIRWRSTCANVGDTLTLWVTSYDNGCPVIRYDTSWLKIAVVAPAIPPSPYPECLTYIDDSTTQIKWQSLSGPDARQIRIYKKNNSNSYQLFDSITQISTRFYIDTTAFDHYKINYCYYLSTVNKCGIESLPSRSICSMYPEDTATSSAFIFTKDTTIFVIASDTLLYQTIVYNVLPNDSVQMQMSGNLNVTNRIIAQTIQDKTGSSTYDLSWVSKCEDIDRKDTLFVNLFIKDNQCPTPRYANAVIKIVVIPPPSDTGIGLRCVRNINQNEVSVGWNASQPGKYFSHWVLIRKNPDGTIIELDKVYSTDSFTRIDNAPQHEKLNYCYATYSVNICGVLGDTSEWSCSVKKSNDFPEKIRIYTVTVEENQYLAIYWQQTTQENFDSYRLYKREQKASGDFDRIAQINDRNKVDFADENVNVSQQVYCYQIRPVNNCGLEAIDNDEACSILLKGESMPFSNLMTWTTYDYWKNGVSEYNIEKSEPGISPFSVTKTNASTKKWVDNNLNYDNGLYYYTVIANENDKINPYSSRSNSIELIQSPILYVPNAFTPNADATNDDWRPKPVFVKDYELKIYNRYGQLIFSTNQKYDFFKGKDLGESASTDAYVYLITYSGWDGSTHSRKGTVTILK